MLADRMTLCLLVNNADTEVPMAATTVIARAAALAGHRVLLTGVADVTYHSENGLTALCREAPEGSRDQDDFIAAVRGENAEREAVPLSEVDVLYLRYNPGDAVHEGQADYDSPILLAQMAVLAGTMVLSHPHRLLSTLNKTYLEQFPASIRPRTVITRNYREVVRFHEEEQGEIVVKPLHGYGGQDVYRIGADAANLKQIVESITRSSAVLAQEFIPEARDGDTRLFLFNGRPLMCDGRYAALRRVNEEGDFRSNMSAGGKPRRADVTPRMLQIAEMVRPRLLADGIFDAGLDIVGDKLVEINPISTGGLNAAQNLESVDFGSEVVRLIERKVAYRRHYGDQLRNRALAVMD